MEMSEAEFTKYLLGLSLGKPVADALLKIDDARIVKPVVASCIDTWAKKYGVSPLDLIDEIADMMYAVHSNETEEE